jgi:hypothetical protein
MMLSPIHIYDTEGSSVSGHRFRVGGTWEYSELLSVELMLGFLFLYQLLMVCAPLRTEFLIASGVLVSLHS